jgi:zinc protease
VGAAPRIVGAALATGSSVEDLEDWPNRIEAVTPDQVMEAARALIAERSSVTGVLKVAPSS